MPSTETDQFHYNDHHHQAEVRRGCVELLDCILAHDPTASVLLLQHVIAPPPPPVDMHDEHGHAYADNGIDGAATAEPEPLGVLLLRGLIGGCVLVGQQASIPESLISYATIVTMVLVHGGSLARELASAISLGLPSFSSRTSKEEDEGSVAQTLLPFLLDTAIAAAQNPEYTHVATALLRYHPCTAPHAPYAVRPSPPPCLSSLTHCDHTYLIRNTHTRTHTLKLTLMPTLTEPTTAHDCTCLHTTAHDCTRHMTTPTGCWRPL